MNTYNVLIKYLGEGEFKFAVKKIGEVSISKDKPVYIYNADVDVINGLRTLRRMLIEITIGAKPNGAFKVYNLEEIDKRNETLKDSRIVADRRGYEAVSGDEVKSILSSGTNGPIIEEAPKKEVKQEETKKTSKKTTKKKSTKKSSKK